MAISTLRSTATREQILAAAQRVLMRDGGAGLSTRTVAAEAGVNLSLIHYHFGSREGLLLTVLDQMNAELLERQHELYGRQDLALAEKWRRAVEFYAADLKSGYVRILLELAAEGFSNAQLASRVRLAMHGWRDLLAQVITGTRTQIGELPLQAEEVASLIVSFWWGMELQYLLGVPEEEGHFWQTLDTIGRLIGRWEKKRRKRTKIQRRR
jgi:AcrR family transcriptional regulator